MNIRLKNSIMIAAVLSGALSSYGAISVELQADLLQDQAGNAIPTNSLVILVADTAGNGFSRIVEGQSVNPKSLISPNGDDYILFKGDLAVFDTPGVLSVSDVINTDGFPGLASGNAIALFWFPSMTVNNTTFISGREYGFYTRATSVNGSDPWTLPALNGGSRSLAFFTSNGSTLSPGGSAANAPAAGRTSNSVLAVPEPTSMGLLSLGLAGLVARRRRK